MKTALLIILCFILSACLSSGNVSEKRRFALVKDGPWTIHPAGQKFHIKGIAKRNELGPYLECSGDSKDTLLMSVNWPENLLEKELTLTAYIEKSTFVLPEDVQFAY